MTPQPAAAAEFREGRENVEVAKTEGSSDRPGGRMLRAGLSGVLGGWSGGTLASTRLSLADFSPLSRGSRIAVAASRETASGWDPKPRRRSARRPPAPTGGRAMERNPPGAKTAPLTAMESCNSETRSDAEAAI